MMRTIRSVKGIPLKIDLSAGPLLIATHNAGKIEEFRHLLSPLGIQLVSARDKGLPEPEETGTTFEANARLKSIAAATATGLPAISDDSGMCVEALDGAPGVYTADWAGVPRDFKRAMQRVQDGLVAAGATEPDQRRAMFVSVISLALPDGTTREFRGEVKGRIVWPPRGSEGVGLDPIFVPEGHERTLGEMEPQEKYSLETGLTHRARAFRAFVNAMTTASDDETAA
jgi:XTP/dITP diphosphohydrolase